MDMTIYMGHLGNKSYDYYIASVVFNLGVMSHRMTQCANFLPFDFVCEFLWLVSEWIQDFLA
jgi:hypothetical protein